jgi:septum formation protein
LVQSALVYLASQSPRRHQLLTQWGAQVQTLLPHAAENAEALEATLPNDTPLQYVERVTRLKLDAALARWQLQGLPPAPILCADTTVALGEQILGKPDTPEHAHAMLSQLSGQTHQVFTSVAVAQPVLQGVVKDVTVHQATSTSWVTFLPLTAAQIQRYVDSGEPMGKAGSYGIQGQASLWIASISGSYSGIMGLPACETAQLLSQVGIPLY